MWNLACLLLSKSLQRSSIRICHPRSLISTLSTKTIMASSSTQDDLYMYPEIEPFDTGMFKVSQVHTLYYEECGKPDGTPVVFLHGGPGSDTAPRDRRFFDPHFYRVVLFHQRGAGKSLPPYCLEENDTWSLVADMEKLREALGIESWLLFGGSWGSTLALAYAEKHIDRVSGIIIRGIFTNRLLEQDWVYKDKGVALIHPEEYAKFIESIPEEERGDIVKAYHKRLTGNDEEEMKRCATAWNRWELSISSLQPATNIEEQCQDHNWNLSHARIECHYFINNGFFQENQLMNNASIIADKGIPVEIIQGRYDLTCPVKTAWELHKRIPQSILHILPLAGHSGKERDTGMTEKLVNICDKFKTVLNQRK